MKYCYQEYTPMCAYDLDHEINLVAAKAQLLAEEIKDTAQNDDDAKVMLKAAMNEFIEAM